jgi:hypothetical protein
MRLFKLLGLFVLLVAAGTTESLAQNSVASSPKTSTGPTGTATEPSTAFSSVDALLGELYGVISGPAGQPRDWDKMKSLFYPGARLIRTQASQTGEFTAAVFTPDDYVVRAGKYFATNGFYEREVSRKTEAWGNLQQIFSTYESRHEANGAPFTRGINSIQLFNDGKRWWILTIAWQEESPTLKLPTEFLPDK